MKRPWWMWVLGMLLLLTTTACAVILPPVYRHRQGATAVIGVKSTAAGCGGIMYLDPEALAVRGGTTVAFTNQMDGMAIRYRLFRKGSAELLGESPWLQPGESWSYAFWLPGDYTLSNNFVDFGFVTGLQASISVGLF
ncbi:MAG: hypothetical protein K0R39_4106 [Symbiobacteriaceae bacterium]|jgi:hypothetical protein|nr:hypothetical protein [Symbiobacteriaceae bacterium]